MAAVNVLSDADVGLAPVLSDADVGIAPPPTAFQAGAQALDRGMGLMGRSFFSGMLSPATNLINLPYQLYNKGADLVEGPGKGFRFQDYRKTVQQGLTEMGFPEPKTPLERVTGDVEGALGGVTGGMGIGQAVSGASAPASTGQALGQALTSSPGMQAASAATGAASGGTAREMGYSPGVQLGATFLGGIVPPTGVALGRALLDTVTPDQLSTENVRLLNAADRLAVPIRPGQAMGHGALKTADEELSRAPLTGYSSQNALRVDPETQREQFNAAISRTFGENDDAITPDVIANAHQRLGQVYQQVLPRNSVAATNADPILNDLSGIKTEAAAIDNALPTHDQGRVGKAVDYVANLLQQPGGMPGKVYQTIRGRNGMIGVLEDDGNSAISHLGTRMRNALDDAFQRQAQGNDGAILQNANAQYRNLKVIEPLAAKAPDGNISPALLLGSVIRHYPNYPQSGAGDIGDLAKIGQLYLKSPPNSMTAERGLVLDFATNPIEAAKKMLALPLSSTLGRAMNMGINSARNRNALMGQALRNPSPLSAYPQAAPGLAQALMNYQGQQ